MRVRKLQKWKQGRPSLGRPEDSRPGRALGTNQTFERPMVAWLVLCLCLFVTFVTWQVSLSEVQARARERFQRNVEQVTRGIRARIQAYEQVLKGAAGLFAASEKVQREEWRRYYSTLEIDEQFPDCARSDM